MTLPDNDLGRKFNLDIRYDNNNGDITAFWVALIPDVIA